MPGNCFSGGGRDSDDSAGGRDARLFGHPNWNFTGETANDEYTCTKTFRAFPFSSPARNLILFKT